jgi:hypothetical protein
VIIELIALAAVAAEPAANAAPARAERRVCTWVQDTASRTRGTRRCTTASERREEQNRRGNEVEGDIFQGQDPGSQLDRDQVPR